MTEESIRKSKQTILQKRTARIAEFWSTHNVDNFRSDFGLLTDQQMRLKYSIGESFYYTLREHLNLKHTRQSTVAKVSLACARKQETIANDFILKFKKPFTSDYRVLTQKELRNKYNISENLMHYICDILHLHDQPKEIKEKAYINRSLSMHASGDIKMHRTLTKKRQARITKFLAMNATQITLDFTILTEKQIMNKYSISLYFLRELKVALHIDPQVFQLKRLATLTTRCGTTNNWYYNKSRSTLLQKYKVTNAFMLSNRPSSTSKVNKNFATLVKAQGIVPTFEKHARNYFYDLVVGNVLIEINPTITHSCVR